MRTSALSAVFASALVALAAPAITGCQGNASSGTPPVASAPATATTASVAASASAAPAAPTPFATYKARLSARDHVNEKDGGLTTVGEILQEDRANYHVYNHRDPEDENDTVFTDLATRMKITSDLTPPPAGDVAAAILKGTPLVQVSIFKTDAGGYQLQVALAGP